ncbi:MAG: ribosome recycling factor [Oceanicoccus sp.]|uniref:ribosome recycling factor n=1 Tax=Oceanicoccus sp. TaxID=2691044 RepID=UPI002612BB41|nr:ribosome recycling factor [Oceanicoccus sp.]MCP3908756.1 ribosome recycling factor [Oceanicoccus sp.]MDG1772215.1 ribosome recycling factor [Oceanicoccus sp.]
MIEDLKKDAEERMEKTLVALGTSLNKIRTGRAHPSILDGIRVSYYGSETPLSQVAAINVEDARTLSVVPWEKNIVPDVEKAIMKSDLGLNPSTAGAVIRIPMPMLTEETRKGFTKRAKQEAEQSRVSVRNIRRDILADLKDLQKEKEISEDEERKAQDDVQKITDRFIAEIDKTLAVKEADLMEI